MFTLKNYQETTLEFLEQYLSSARIIGAKAAFEKVAGENPGVIFRAYQPLSDAIYETPYVCLRLPTGGGKTLLATYAIQKAAQSYMDTDCPLVLWVVPTSTIKEQTLNALRTPGHPYRDALEENFDNRFRVLDISEFTQIRPQDLKSKTNIVLATFASYRVKNDNEEMRKVYAHHEDLESHFSKLPNLGNGFDCDDDGKVKASFINLLRLHRPLVIVDEAHNHNSLLSVERVERINPACIVEFTATPAEDSNILHNVSASELKAEEMIKLPIELTEHETWQEAIHASVQTRQKLHELAEQDKEYIRPIVLLQAEKVNQDVTVEVIENYLVEEEGIDRSRIAIATGNQRELDGIDLFDRKSNIEFVITVEALKEGWDCSFAYVLCSVASKRSAKDVEQILGRVLRMPYANKRAQDALNRAYAHVSSPTWKNAAAQIHDRLVDMGFDEKEAQESIRLQRPVPQKDFFFGYENGGMELPVCRFVAETAPDLKDVAPEEQGKIEIKRLASGGVNISIKGVLSPAAENQIAKTLKGNEKKNFKTEMELRRFQEARRDCPAVKGTLFAVPQLCLELDGFVDVASEELYMENGWRLSDYPAELPGFQIKEENDRWMIDLQGGRVIEQHIGKDHAELNLDDMKTPWTEDQLVGWLDAHLNQPDLSQSDLCLFIRNTVRHLNDSRGIHYATQQRFIFLLQKAFAERISDCRKDAQKKGFQAALFAPEASVCTREEFQYTFTPDSYPAHRHYTGSYQFKNHYFPIVGELKNEGEEFECAKAIDQNPQVEFWVRNLERRDSCAFSLPVSTGRFYPDFIAKLKNGNIIVIEYKGDMLVDKQSEKEKAEIGKLWGRKSKEKALFLFAVKKDEQGRSVEQQLRDKISKALDDG
jgi:type III restriction enzyme